MSLKVMRMAAAGLVAASLIGSWAEAAELVVGSKAPPISIEHWIQTREGAFQPVTEFARGKVYVIEFWATWCGPCVAMMPHLAALQDAYVDKGVTIISVSDEEPQAIESFLDAKIGDVHSSLGKINGEFLREKAADTDTFRDVTKRFCLTTDPDRSVEKDYFVAAGQTGLPVAFIVGKTGEIEWIGHSGPGGKLGEMLGFIVGDDWDRAAYEAYQKRLAPINKLLVSDDPMQAVALIDELIKDFSNDFLQKQLVKSRDHVLAEASRQVAFLTLQKSLRKGGSEAIEAIGAFVATAGNSVEQLSDAAWAVIGLVEQKEDVSAEVLEAARAAVTKGAGLEPDSFVLLQPLTLAHLQAAQGDVERAITTLKKALEHATGLTEVRIRKHLELLEACAVQR